MEKKILGAALQSREAFNRIRKLVNPREFSDVSRELWQLIEGYYDLDEKAQEVDIGLFKERVIDEIPRHSDVILLELDALSDTSVPNLIEELTKLKKKALSEAIIMELASKHDSDKALDLMDEFRSVAIEDIKDPEPVSASARSVLEELANPENLIRIYPTILNEAIDGGVIRGNHILIFAKTNVGKTMAVINMARGMARDGYRVLHLINEEPRKQVLQRYVSRCSGLTKREVYADIDGAIALAEANGLSNIFIEDINPGTFSEIRGLIEKIKPDIVIIDQLRNIRMRDESRVNQLEQAATEARNLAKKYDIVVISVTQAGDTASNKPVLTDSDIDSSKVGIPAQCDLILGVGMDEQQRSAGMRTITIVKNKINNVHDYYPCRVDESLSKIVST